MRAGQQSEHAATGPGQERTASGDVSSDARAQAAEPTLGPRAYDPRLVRKLPWRFTLEDRQRFGDPSPGIPLGEFSWVCAWAGFYSVTLLVLPLGYFGRLVWRRRWSLRTTLFAPVVVAVMMAVLMAPLPAGFGGSNWEKWGLGVMALPGLAFLGLTIRWSVQRRWRKLAAWLGVSVGAAAVMAAVYLLIIAPMNPGVGPLQPGERWDPQGWYGVWFFAAYLTGWAMLTLLPLFYAARAGWRRFRAKRRPAASAA